jgi:hypothetical protein
VSGADLSDEVDRFVGGLTSDDEPPRTKRRRAATKALPPPTNLDEREDLVERDPPDDPDGDDEADPVPSLPRELPRPSDTQKTLASVLSKWGLGDNPEFKLQLHRLLPKWLPGGIQGNGYLNEYVHPISEEYIASEYGGGTYEVRVLGPDPKKGPNGIGRYDTFKVEIAGAPNPERLARSVQAKLDAATGQQQAQHVGPPMVVQQQENPGLATQALKMASEMADREREERRRAEDKATSTAEQARSMFEPVVEAHRQRADELLRSERERAATERKYLEDRLQEARDEYRRLEAKVEAMNATPQVSIAEEISKLMPMLKGDGDAAAAAQKAAESITKSILDRQQIEVESMHKQHQTMLESLRQSHISEIASMREAGRREIETEREAGRLREQRHDETLKAEREERRRDVELYKRQADERDQQWRDRMEQQELNLKVMWESRVETQKSNYESQLQWLRSEIDQLQGRVRSFEAQMADRGDLVKQLSGMSQLRSVAKDALGIEDPPPPPSGGGSGGIGLSGAGGDQSWQEVISTAIENLPAIWQTINGPGGMMGGGQQQQQPQQQPQQPPPQPGQIIQTPQGPMVVVQAPNGQLALAPKDQYDAYNAQRTSRQVGTPRPRGILAQPKPKQPSSGLPVPDMSIGLPKPRAWGEPVQPPLPVDQQQQQPVAVAAAPQQQGPQRSARRGRPEQQVQQQGDAVDPKIQMMIAKEVAKRVHESVEGGDEPEEFVQKMLNGGYPPMIIQAIAGMSDAEVLAGIKQAEPNSAGTTPRGQRFVHAALAALRAAI